MEPTHQFRAKNEILVNGVKNDRCLKQYLTATEKKGRQKEVKSKIRKFDTKRADKMAKCGNYMEYEVREDMSRKLVKAHFCKDIFCPICQAKRSSLEARQLRSFHDEVEQMKLSPYHVVLTLKGRKEPLEKQRKELWKYFRQFRERKFMADRIEGHFSSLEVHWSEEHGWKLHLHIYMVFSKQVPREMNKKQWEELLKKMSEIWYDVTGDSYIIGLDSIKNIYQLTKYITKPHDLLKMPDDKFQELAQTMKGKRLRTSGGIIGEIKQEFTEKEMMEEENEEGGEDLEIIGYERWKWNGRAYTVYVDDADVDMTVARTPGGL